MLFEVDLPRSHLVLGLETSEGMENDLFEFQKNMQ